MRKGFQRLGCAIQEQHDSLKGGFFIFIDWKSQALKTQKWAKSPFAICATFLNGFLSKVFALPAAKRKYWPKSNLVQNRFPPQTEETSGKETGNVSEREVLAKRGHIAASPIEYSNLMRHDSAGGQTLFTQEGRSRMFEEQEEIHSSHDIGS